MTYFFGSGMERIHVLSDLRNDHVFPPGFEASFPTEAKLVAWLTRDNPRDRPTAAELLKVRVHALAAVSGYG